MIYPQRNNWGQVTTSPYCYGCDDLERKREQAVRDIGRNLDDLIKEANENEWSEILGSLINAKVQLLSAEERRKYAAFKAQQ